MEQAVLDIETTSLKPLTGRVLCAVFHPLDKNEEPVLVTSRQESVSMKHDENVFVSHRPGRDLLDDLMVLQTIKDYIQAQHCIITWNGKLFDIPFINARLSRWGETPYKPQFHMDMMYYAGQGQCGIGSRRMETVAQYFEIEQKKKLPIETWMKANVGDEEALFAIEDRCLSDCRITEELYHILLPYVRNIHA